MTLLVIASIYMCLILSIGRNTISGNPIVGGELSNIHSYPWLASIQKNGYHHCVGSIISKSIILTAAHCIEDSADSYIVRVGSSRTNSGGSWRQVVAVQQHEKYAVIPSFARILNDIGLIRVSPSFEFGVDVSKVQLAEVGHEVTTGTAVTAAGWGSEWYGGPSIFNLKTTNLLIIDSKECAEAYGDYTGKTIRSNNQFCAAGEHRDVCDGDSGGPLIEQNVQIGIVSTGIGCADPQFPGVYVDVSRYRNWIETNSQILNQKNVKVSTSFVGVIISSITFI